MLRSGVLPVVELVVRKQVWRGWTPAGGLLRIFTLLSAERCFHTFHFDATKRMEFTSEGRAHEHSPSLHCREMQNTPAGINVESRRKV